MTDVALSKPGSLGLDLPAAEGIAAPQTPGQLAWRRFTRHRMAVFGMVGLALLVIFTIAGSFAITEREANRGDLRARLEGPSAEHFFGTDSTGRDVMSRIIYGGQISLLIGVMSVVLSVTVGTLVGGVAAYYGGWLDAVLMRITEAWLTIPQLFLLIVLGKYLSTDLPSIRVFGRELSGSVGVVIVVIGATSWMYLARIVRANILSLREMDYISASHALGANAPRIILGHLVPNTIAPIIVAATLGLASAILSEAYVSFLGLGVQAPTATWGNMMEASISFIQKGAWWLWLFPSLFIILTILCINLVGDGLRDALDPRTAKHLG